MGASKVGLDWACLFLPHKRKRFSPASQALNGGGLHPSLLWGICLKETLLGKASPASDHVAGPTLTDRGLPLLPFLNFLDFFARE